MLGSKRPAGEVEAADEGVDLGHGGDPLGVRTTLMARSGYSWTARPTAG
jgi:hypothetical protein